MEVLIGSLLVVAEWRLKKEELYQPNAPNTALHPCGLLSLAPLNRKGRQTPGLLDTIVAEIELSLSS
jgi:hypothetical protein